MKEVILQIPTLDAEQNVEIDVKINGRKRTIKYRVEIVDIDDLENSTENTVTVLRRVIKEHNKDWELVQIGAPSKNNIPVMFRQRVEEKGD